MSQPSTATASMSESNAKAGSHGEKSKSESAQEDDVLIVDWNDDGDPENPRNWPIARKWYATIVVSGFTFMSPLSSSMIAPAAQQMASDLNIHGSFLTELSVSIFILAYAVGPLFLGPLSELYGRSRVLQSANMWFLVWNLVCGFAQSPAQIIIFRFLAGIGGSAPFAVGGGVLGDLFAPSNRGQAIAIYSLAPLLGPVIGPIAGGWISEKTTWRWVFWSSTIADAVVQIFGFILLKETFAPVLLERRANKIIKEMKAENDGQHRTVKTPYQGADRTWRTILGRALGRPFRLFFQEPILMLLGLYMVIIYGLREFYLVLTQIPDIFAKEYHQRPGIAGLHYIALGVGVSGANLFNALTLNPIYKYFATKAGGLGRPEFRLPPMVPASVLLPIGLFIFGWGAEKQVHWIVVDVGLAFVGAGIILAFQSVQTYIIDAFTLFAASALAAVACLRACAGFGFPLFAPAMYGALGYGVGNTVLACIALVVGCPSPWLFWYFGQRIREMSKHATKDEKPI